MGDENSWAQVKTQRHLLCLLICIYSETLLYHLCVANIITENSELSAARVQDVLVIGISFSTEIDAGVSELCRLDVEVTCVVSSVVHWRRAESWWNVVGDTETDVD